MPRIIKLWIWRGGQLLEGGGGGLNDLISTAAYLGPYSTLEDTVVVRGQVGSMDTPKSRACCVGYILYMYLAQHKHIKFH